MNESGLQRVCALEDIPEGGGRETVLENDEGQVPVMLLKQGGEVYGYVNVCPHQGRMLNFAPNRFMVRGGEVMCSHHGATFRVTDGACTGGPCRGAPLRPVAAVVQDGDVLIGEKDNARGT